MKEGGKSLKKGERGRERPGISAAEPVLFNHIGEGNWQRGVEKNAIKNIIRGWISSPRQEENRIGVDAFSFKASRSR